MILNYYLMMSLLTFFIYGVDKFAAKQSWSRMPEKFLHLLSLFGGWIGGFMAQKLFNHKSSKRRFKVVYWITVVLNLMVLILWLHYKGKISF
jgi:uncharacterized membrane protein YsdA (DUF1294 family)